MQEDRTNTGYIKYLKRNFFNTAIADIYRALDGKSLVGSTILTFCLMDYLTWIEFGENGNSFDKFIQKRLLPQNIRYKNKEEELYSVRCGLVHSYGPSKKIIAQKFAGYLLHECAPDRHLQKINTNVLHICLFSLLTETIFSAHEIFEESANVCTKEQLERMDKQIKISGVEAPEKFELMHRALMCFDKPDDITLSDIQSDYTSKILNH